MKKLLSIIFISFFITFTVIAQQQNSSQLSQIAILRNGTDFIRFRPNIKLRPDEVFSTYKSMFSLRNQTDRMKLLTKNTDNLKITHHKFQQYYEDIPVEGAQYILHVADGFTKTGNGSLVPDLKLNVNPSISADKAVENAILYMRLNFGATKFKWEDKQAEKMLKQIKNDNYATYYPRAELVITDKNYSKKASDYILAYKMIVYSVKPLYRLQLFVDALTGDIYNTVNMLFDYDRQAVAKTIYDGTQNIMVDSIAPDNYRLREEGRGNGIMTYTLENSMYYPSAVDVTSPSLSFESDKIANEAHWGAEKTYDYYMMKFGRNSYDDKGAALISYVHYGESYINAFWDGTAMSYGDGGYGYNPFTALDVCGHEITHAVSQMTAGLIYQNESGALNESFSDIFGTSIEFTYAPSPNWLIGEDLAASPLRSMANPNLCKQPDTYKGKFWLTGSSDYGGVHTNSGVPNYWFYLLATGGSGTNDNGHNFNVAGIGLESAERIAYQTMTHYLTPTSKFIDAYYGSIQAATDLFGNCSNEARQTALAWDAVGVGYPLSNDEVFISEILTPASACGIDMAAVSMNLYYAGCDSALKAGQKVVIAYKFDSNPLVYDTLILSDNWTGGNILKCSFKTPADASKIGKHTVNCYAKLGDKTVHFNDSIMNYQFTNILHQNIDVGAVKVNSPVSGCGLTNNDVVAMSFTFYGCDSIPKGDTIALSYKVNSWEPWVEKYVLPQTLYPHSIINYTFKTIPDLTDIHGAVKITASTKYAKDTFNLNDAIVYSITNPVSLSENTVTFDETNTKDFFYYTTTGYSHASVSVAAKKTGKNGFLMTGGNIRNFYHMFQLPDKDNVWQVNDFLSAKINFCVDATKWAHVNMKFDLKQTHGGAIYEQYLGPNDYSLASNLRVLANNTQIGETYNPSTGNSDPWKSVQVNLDDYAGSKFILTMESRCISKDSTIGGVYTLKMDNVYIDNVSFSEMQQGIGDINPDKFSAELYPSQVKDVYSIDLVSDEYQQLRFETYDLYGKLIRSSEQYAYTGKNKFMFSCADLSKGIYLVRMTGKTKTVTMKFVKE